MPRPLLSGTRGGLATVTMTGTQDEDTLDSAGIGILASVMWSASQAGGGMVLASLPATVEKLLGIVMLLDRIDHADSRESALAKLRQQ